jgi:bacillithiol biosynthesis deacetylase BshB1
LDKVDCLAFGAHPDDVELFCSGLLLKLKAQGYKTGVIDLTQGELSTNGDVESRQIEAKRAAEILQLDYRANVGIEDGNIENSQKNRMAIIRLIRKIRPYICLIPFWEDRHPDHRAASLILRDSIFYSGLKKIITDQKEYRPITILYYMLHKTFIPSFIIDITEEMETKMTTIRVYKSQFELSSGISETTFINRPDFLETIGTRAQFYGQKIGCKYGEPYFFDGSLKIDNIMQIFT